MFFSLCFIKCLVFHTLPMRFIKYDTFICIYGYIYEGLGVFPLLPEALGPVQLVHLLGTHEYVETLFKFFI